MISRRSRGAATLALLVATMASGALDAGCGLKRRHRCTATATYLGKAREGSGSDFDDEAKARALAIRDICVRYCEREDPDVDAALVKAKGKPPADFVERVNTLNDPAVAPVVTTCKTRCDAAIATPPPQMKCEKSGI